MLCDVLLVNATVVIICQMLISSRNALTDIPKNNVQPNIWTFCNPVKLTHKIKHQKPTPCQLGTYMHLLKPYFIS